MYRVSACIERCSDVYCKAFHPNKREYPRRRPMRGGNGIWMYLPLRCIEAECREAECCFAHSTTEVLYHPMLYKTKMCDQGPLQDGVCTKFGPHCPFIHIEKDGAGLPGLPYNRNSPFQKPPLMPNLESQRAYKQETRTYLDTYTELPKSRTHIISHSASFPVQNSCFNRATYKVFPCSTPACKRNVYCMGYHTLEERRRAEDQQYSQQPCGYVYFGEERGFEDIGKCPMGDKCTYSHTENEVYFHKRMYKQKPCLNYLQRSSCPHPYCPFLHDRNPNSLFPVPSLQSQAQITKVLANIQRLRAVLQAANNELNRVNLIGKCTGCEKEGVYVYWCGHIVCEGCILPKGRNGVYECLHCGEQSSSTVRLVRS